MKGSCYTFLVVRTFETGSENWITHFLICWFAKVMLTMEERQAMDVCSPIYTVEMEGIFRYIRVHWKTAKKDLSNFFRLIFSILNSHSGMSTHIEEAHWVNKILDSNAIIITLPFCANRWWFVTTYKINVFATFSPTPPEGPFNLMRHSTLILNTDTPKSKSILQAFFFFWRSHFKVTSSTFYTSWQGKGS